MFDIKNLAQALCKAQGKMASAKKDAENPFFKSNYATMESVVSVFQEFFAPEGLCFFHTPYLLPDGSQGLKITLAHTSGESVSGEYRISPVKADPQSVGSAITYARRYSLSALTGIVVDADDDAEAAQGRGHQKKTSPQTHQPAPKKESQPSKPDPVQVCVAAFREVLKSPVSECWEKFLKKEKGYNAKMRQGLSQEQQASVSAEVSKLVLEIAESILSTASNISLLEHYWSMYANDWFCRMRDVDIEIIKAGYADLSDRLPDIKNHSQGGEYAPDEKVPA